MRAHVIDGAFVRAVRRSVVASDRGSARRRPAPVGSAVLPYAICNAPLSSEPYPQMLRCFVMRSSGRKRGRDLTGSASVLRSSRSVG
ncbi:hypothetical protein MRX96_046474 [Rhipicephalus microplus]